MRSAYEVTLVYAMNRANRNARAAVCAKRVIDGCEVINNLYRTRRTGLFALHTADTAVFALLAGNRALFVI